MIRRDVADARRRLPVRLCTALAFLATAVTVVLASPVPSGQPAAANGVNYGCGGASSAVFSSGAGTVGDPYIVTNSAQLAALVVNNQQVAYRQACDITLTNFPGIGDSSSLSGAFNGVYDGGGFAVTGTIAPRTGSFPNTGSGLFQRTNNATIRNLQLRDVTISATVNLVGLLVGHAARTSISSVTVSGGVATGGVRVGGLIGYVEYPVSISASSVSGRVTGTGNYVGGLVGYVHDHLRVMNSIVSMTVSGIQEVGGVAGHLHDGETFAVSGTTITGSVMASGAYAGGVVGFTSPGVVVDVSTSAVSASVSADNESGGVIGRANGNVTISAVSRSGLVSVSATSYAAGGFVGYTAGTSLLVVDSSSSSDVRGQSEIGGAVGSLGRPVTLHNVVLSGTVYGAPVSGTTEVGCYVGTVLDGDDPNNVTLSGTTRATGSKVVDGVTTRCPDWVPPQTGGAVPLPPAVSELVTRPVATTTSAPASTTVPSSTTLAPATTVAPATTILAPVPVGGALPELAPGDRQVLTDGRATDVEVFVDNSTDLVLRGQDFELRLKGDCRTDCVIDVETSGRELLTLEERGRANVSGEGFLPGTPVHVWLFSEPRFLGTLTVQPDGTFTGQVPLNDVDPGLHTLQVNGTSFDGLPRSANLGVRVLPGEAPAPGPGALPATGTDSAPLWLLALVLLGAGLVATSRRRGVSGG